MKLAEIIANDLVAIQEKKPLIHSITNFVMMNETANAVLCIGAEPIMAHAKEEVEEVVSLAGALVLNIGTLDMDWIDAMELAGKRANELDIPVILDPLGIGATRFRRECSKRLIQNVDISIIRGNIEEVTTLAEVSTEVCGMKPVPPDADNEEIAREFASAYGCIVAITGPVDVVSDGSRLVRIGNGDVMLSKVVGTGCMANVLVAAFAAVQPDRLIATIGGLVTLGIAGEIAAHDNPGKPGTFHTALYNELYGLETQDILDLARVKVISKGSADEIYSPQEGNAGMGNIGFQQEDGILATG